MPQVITDNLDLWILTLRKKSSASRGSNGQQETYGVRKLRELILELAMRGRMVPQDSNDEPASALLERIANEKARLRRAGGVKEERPLPGISQTEKPFELPDGWEWVRFGSIAQHNSGKTLDGGRNTGPLRDYITTSNLYWGRFDLGSIKQMAIADEELEKCTARKGDLLLCEGGEAGRAAVWPYDKDICFQNHIHRVRFYGEIDAYFAYRFFEKLNATGEINQYRKGVGISNMSSKSLALIVMPLPPLAEQHRIVAKVDELMALCDRLEQQQSHSIEARQTLLETLLGLLTRGASPQELHEAWNRIASHFDTLFTTEHSIQQLQQTILQLAVRGKLVAQHLDDEPASVLLNRIAAQRDRLANEGKLSKTKPLPPVADDEKAFVIPNGWIWTRLDNLALHSEAGWSPSCEPTPRQGDNWGVLKVSAVTWGKYEPQANKALPANLSPKPELEVMPGDFLISRANTAELVAKAVVVPNGAPPHLMMSDKIIRFVFASEVNQDYITLVNQSDFSREYYARVAGGTSSSMKNVSREQIRSLVVPLPPLAEQKRIVASVKVLMTLCDAIKTHIADAQTTQVHLADAFVEKAIA